MVKIARAALATLVCVIALATTAASQDATGDWDRLANGWNFDTTSQLSAPYATVAQAYNGSNWSADLAGIREDMEEATGAGSPPISGDEILISTLQNWPNP